MTLVLPKGLSKAIRFTLQAGCELSFQGQEFQVLTQCIVFEGAALLCSRVSSSALASCSWTFVGHPGLTGPLGLPTNVSTYFDILP